MTKDTIKQALEALQQAEAGLEFAIGKLPAPKTDFIPAERLALNIVRETLAALEAEQQEEAQPKYSVAWNHCDCHPETCSCGDWAVIKPDGGKHGTYMNRDSAELVANALNRATPSDAQPQEQPKPVEIPGRISTKWLREIAQDAGFVLNPVDMLVVPAPHDDATPYLRRLVKLLAAPVTVQPASSDSTFDLAMYWQKKAISLEGELNRMNEKLQPAWRDLTPDETRRIYAQWDHAGEVAHGLYVRFRDAALTRCATSKEGSDAAQYPIGTIEVKGGECVKAWYDAALPDGFHKIYAAQAAQQATAPEAASVPVQAVTDAELLAAFNSADSVIDGLHEVCRLISGSAKTK